MRTELYPEIEIYKEHMILVSDLHTIYVDPIRPTWMWKKYAVCVFRRKHHA